MKIDGQTFKLGLKRVEDVTSRSTLPTWDELPNLELYMDQVIALVNGYLVFFSDDEENIITHSMINNYVKQKVIPMPQKKRYCRTHLACLIMIGALKHALSISTIQFLLPNDCDEAEAELIYNKFVNSWENSLTMATEMFEDQLKMLMKQERYNEVYNLATDMAVGSNIFKVFTDKLIGLHPENEEKQKPKKERREKSDKLEKDGE